MKKFDLGQTLTILANIGVIAGIVFLAIEIRDSRTAILAQTQDSITDGWLALNLATISDPQVGLDFQKGLCEPEQLNSLEATRFSMQLRAMFNQYRRIYRLYEKGLLDPDEWALYGTEASQFLRSPGGVSHFSGNALEPDLRAAIESFSDQSSNVSLRLDGGSQTLCSG
jgi:hypothetical protein